MGHFDGAICGYQIKSEEGEGMINTSEISLARPNSIDVSLRDLVAPFFRRKRALLATFPIVFLAVILAGLLVPAEFSSHMSILVSRERVDPLITTEASPQMLNLSPLSEEEIYSEAELLRSSDVLEGVVRANGLQTLHQSQLLDILHPKRNEADRVALAVRSLAKRLSIAPAIKTNLIEVTYSSTDPHLAYGVLKSLGELYVQKHIQVHQHPGSYEFFAKETDRYKEALDHSEARLRALGQLQGVADPDDERTDMAQQLAAALGQSRTIEDAIAADQQRIESDRAQMKITPQRSQTRQDTQAASLLLQNLGSSLLAAEAKRTQLLLKYEPGYPLVQEAEKEVADAKAAIADARRTPYVSETIDRDPTFELLREELAKSEADLAGQKASLEANRRGIDTMKWEMVKLGSQSLEQADLQREAKANEQNYLLYLSKREQERTSSALDSTKIADVAVAVPPAIPVLPAYGFLSILQIALGLATLASMIAAYSIEYFDRSFNTPGQVVETLGIPLVVAMPKRTA
jgi:uncharacterized protein involved in exopolysaccharide biosynthesis